MKKYKNFESAISNFTSDMMLSHVDAIVTIEIAINSGYINKIELGS